MECAIVAKPKQRWTKLSTLLVSQGGTFTMPGKFKVPIKLVTKGAEHDDMDTHAYAEFEHDTNIITLRTSRKRRQRRSDLEHELQHMAVDWINHVMHKVRIKVK